MKTYNKGISLIVLVITIIVLAILATTVIISLSNTNIIKQATDATFKSDMANYKEAYNMYLVDYMAKHGGMLLEDLNVKYGDREFDEIFGEDVPEKYRLGLQIFGGQLMYNTTDETERQIVTDLNMVAKTLIPDTLTIGDLVSYTPTASATGSYEGATYVKDTDEESATYNTYIESTTTYTPGTLKWKYLGQDENGNVLLISDDVTSFEMKIGGQDGWVTGPDRMDALCNTLYGNSTYAIETRNIKVEDINRVLGYDGPLGTYWGTSSNNKVKTDEPMSFGEIEAAKGITLTNRQSPRLSTISFEDCLSDYYDYTSWPYNKPFEYKTIFQNSKGNIAYWISSSVAYVIFRDDLARFVLRIVNGGGLSSGNVFGSDGTEKAPDWPLRPVVVLRSNVQFNEKNSNGEWTLIAM